jgi:hypothetical protein
VRQLHLVGFTPDHAGLLLAGQPGAESGSYVLALDSRVLEQIEVARRMQKGDSAPAPAWAPEMRSDHSRAGSALSPREIQARLRAGRSVAEVAAEAGVREEWVERFAGPVFAEQWAAVARAAALKLATPRRGESDRPLADSVLRNLADRGIALADDEVAAGWSACHIMDSEWRVSFRFMSRGRPTEAEWLLDASAGTLVARNRIGAELGFVDPDRHATFTRELPPLRVRQVAPARPVPPGTGSQKAPVSKKTPITKKAPGTKKAPTTEKAIPRKVAAEELSVAKTAPSERAVFAPPLPFAPQSGDLQSGDLQSGDPQPGDPQPGDPQPGDEPVAVVAPADRSEAGT